MEEISSNMVLDHLPVLSLKELCLVKIAIAISNDPEVKTFVELYDFPITRSNDSFLSWVPLPCFRWGDLPPLLLENDPPFLLEEEEELLMDVDDNSCDCMRYYVSEFYKRNFLESRLSRVYSRYSRWKALIAKKVSFILLPNSLEKDLMAFVRHISSEVMKWVENHSNILHGTSKLHTYFHWKSQGIINKEETAKSLLRNEELSVRERYALASFYGFKDDALDLWKKLTWGEKYLVGYDFPSLGVWNKWMKGERMDYDSLADYRVWVGDNNLSNNRLWKFYYHLGVRTLFPKLSPEKRLQWLNNSLKEEVIDYEEFHFCLSFIDAHEKENIFKEYPFHVLVYFLNWPLLGEFIEVADHMWSYISGRMFFLLLHFIIYQKISKDWSEFNFFQLLKMFWFHSPDHLKACIQSKNIFDVILIALDCQNKGSFLSEQVVKYCEKLHYAHHDRETENIG